MGFEASLTARERDLVEAAAHFTDTEIMPNAAAWERDRIYPRDVQMKAAELGLGGLLTPEADGGLGMSFTAACRVFEELARGCMAFTFSLVVHNNFVLSISANGSAEQKRKYLPDMLACRKIGTFLLTEPGMGSDAAAVACRAIPDEDGWRIEGEKAWISSASDAEILSLYAQADPTRGSRGLIAFTLETDRAGVHRTGPYDMAGGHALGTGGFRFDGARVTKEDVLIPQGEAFKAAMSGIDSARVYVAAMSLGMMRAALSRAVDYTKTRPAFGQTISAFQGVQWMLADVATDIEATRLLTYSASALLDAGADATAAAAHAKKFATRASLARLADCMQVMGANGFRLEEPAARHLATAKMSQYMDGATEIQNVVLARKLGLG
ncbi:MAG: acyl-CoA dehydrogenase family protein [Minwuia sp.]|uniref:acyl-CoA dehydrogenase family protein n=1 Tax=Minwuia sp. TaxID=2493630 RepID=UPI003A8759EB